MTDIDPAIADGIDAIEQAYARVRTRIVRGVDGRHGFAAATELRDRLDKLVGDAAGLRGFEVVKIRDTEGPMSLSQLGEAAGGVSKPRAMAFVRAGEQYEIEETTR